MASTPKTYEPKEGHKVAFTTHHGRKGTGKVKAVRDTINGKWFDVLDNTGRHTSLRRVQITGRA